MAKKLKIGIIGSGGIARGAHMKGYASIPDLCEMVAVCDINAENAQKAADEYGVGKIYTDYKDMLADPEIDAVSVAYLPRNAPPVIQQIEITPANYRFPAQSLTITPSRNLTLQPLGRPRRAAAPVPMAESGQVTLQYEKGQIGARWAASDENGDDLISRVEIRGARESEWRLLKDKIKEKHLSWDSTAFADGEYLLRVTVSDLPDNPPGQELTAQLVSAPFLIDNSAPVIEGLSASLSGARLSARWRASDALSVLYSAEYSLDGGEWLAVDPTTTITDSQAHDYALALDGLAAGEHTLAVRVTDAYDNQVVAKAVVR